LSASGAAVCFDQVSRRPSGVAGPVLIALIRTRLYIAVTSLAAGEEWAICGV